MAILFAGLHFGLPHVLEHPLDRIATTQQLIDKFEETTFTHDSGDRTDRITRWAGPVRISVAGDFPDFLRPWLRLYIKDLRPLTGLDISIVTRERDANIRIFHVPSHEFTSLYWRPVGEFDEIKISDDLKAACFFSPGMVRGGYFNDGKITSAMIGIGAEYNEHRRRHCLLEELYQGLGPGKNTSIIRPSISSNEDQLTELSINDKILLRAYHDPRITPGMHRNEVMALARKIIHDLVEAVKKDGEAALVHPNWRQRQGK